MLPPVVRGQVERSPYQITFGPLTRVDPQTTGMYRLSSAVANPKSPSPDGAGSTTFGVGRM